MMICKWQTQATSLPVSNLSCDQDYDFKGVDPKGDPLEVSQSPFYLKPNQTRVLTSVLANDPRHKRMILGLGPALGTHHHILVDHMEEAYPESQLLWGGEKMIVGSESEAGIGRIAAINDNSRHFEQHELPNDPFALLSLVSTHVLPFGGVSDAFVAKTPERSLQIDKALGVTEGLKNLRHDANNILTFFLSSFDIMSYYELDEFPADGVDIDFFFETGIEEREENLDAARRTLTVVDLYMKLSEDQSVAPLRDLTLRFLNLESIEPREFAKLVDDCYTKHMRKIINYIKGHEVPVHFFEMPQL